MQKEIEACPNCGAEAFSMLDEMDSIKGSEYIVWQCNECEYEEHVDEGGEMYIVELKHIER